MDFSLTVKKIEHVISRASRVLLVGHQRPDADALGSIQAFGGWLRQLNIDYVCYCADRADNPNLEFLTDWEPYVTTPEEVLGQRYDLIVVFDSGDLEYAGTDQLVQRLSPRPIIVNIDHHFTNLAYGDINLVDASAASTTEILHRFFNQLRVAVTPQMSSALLAGIINDTYNFTNANTGYATLAAASRLLAQGANLQHVSQAILQTKPLAAMQFWGETLLRLEYNKEWELATVVITHADVAKLESQMPRNAGDPREVTEGVANFLNNLGGVKAALVLREQSDGTIKGSFRTNDDLIDVSALAKMLGGGGHRKAAGFTLAGRLEQTPRGWQVK